MQKERCNYIQLAQQLRAAIAQGKYPAGSLLPTEMQLCELHGTSRHTVRAALKELQELGLVVRKRNVGTRVTGAHVEQNFQSAQASLDDLIQFGGTHIRALQHIDEVILDEAQAQELLSPPNSRWLRFSSLRLKDGQPQSPLGWTDVYIDPSYSDIANDVRQHPETLISTLIERRYGRRIAEVRQEIFAATLADPAMSKALLLTPQSAVLRIVRHYADAAGQVFEMSVSIHPAERFSLLSHLKRASGANIEPTKA